MPRVAATTERDNVSSPLLPPPLVRSMVDIEPTRGIAHLAAPARPSQCRLADELPMLGPQIVGIRHRLERCHDRHVRSRPFLPRQRRAIPCSASPAHLWRVLRSGSARCLPYLLEASAASADNDASPNTKARCFAGGGSQSLRKGFCWHFRDRPVHLDDLLFARLTRGGGLP
jgi:hypothetical protein